MSFQTTDRDQILPRQRQYLALLESADKAKSDNDYARAESLYRVVAQAIHDTVGPNDTEYAIALYNIAQALEGQLRNQEANDLREQARNILVKQQDPIIVIEELSSAY